MQPCGARLPTIACYLASIEHSNTFGLLSKFDSTTTIASSGYGLLPGRSIGRSHYGTAPLPADFVSLFTGHA